jgi:hypothetical protein
LAKPKQEQLAAVYSTVASEARDLRLRRAGNGQPDDGRAGEIVERKMSRPALTFRLRWARGDIKRTQIRSSLASPCGFMPAEL